MGFSGVDTYVTLGMLLARLLDMAEDGHTVLIDTDGITVGGHHRGLSHVPLTLSDVEGVLRDVTSLRAL